MLQQVCFVVRAAAGKAAIRIVANASGMILSGLLATTCCFTQIANAGEESRINGWYVDFEKAEALAKANRIPIVIHFHAHWCGPCQTMESEVLNTTEVRAALGSTIIGVKVHCDDRRDLVARFGISSLPTDVIVSADGRILSKDVGSPGRTAYVARLARFRAPARVQPGRTGTLLARTSGTNSKVPVTAAPPEMKADVLPTTSSGAAGVNVVSNSDSVAPGESTIPSSVVSVAMTKTLRRESNERIGMSGYSPVSLTETGKWKSGEAQFKHEFEGVGYLLSSLEELERFKASPEKFVPALHGCDPVVLVNEQIIETGHIELGVTYRSKVYFFASRKTRDAFMSDPNRFSGTLNLAILVDNQ